MVRIPAATSRLSVTGPIPGTLRTGSGAKRRSSSPTRTMSTPAGLASPLAIFATVRVAPTPALEGVDGGRGPLEARDLDRLIHQRTRLSIVSALAVNDSLTFNELKRLLGTTDGNLSVHARKLEDAGYLRCDKTFEARMPKSEYRLTAAGRAALESGAAGLHQLIPEIPAVGQRSGAA